MTVKILLVNPPIYDFTAYDFWLKPYGLLSVAGSLRGQAEFSLFDYVDRQSDFMTAQKPLKSDQWGRGRLCHEIIPSPPCLEKIPRYFRRFGLPRGMFIRFLHRHGPFDLAFVQTMMTYWYPAVQEVIEDIRRYSPSSRIVLGGNYVTICAGHAQKLGADFLVRGTDLQPLWQYLSLSPDTSQPALWEAYEKLKVGTLKLTQGCPFDCTYCCVPKLYSGFTARSLDRSLTELHLLLKLGAKNIAFYDDALLFQPEQVLIPFLEEVLRRDIAVNFHTPNALNARFVTKPIADLLVRAGFKTFYLGFESASADWHKRTGSKAFSEELATAVEHLTTAGALPGSITAYNLLGHPHATIQQVEQSVHFASSLNIRGMLADFSPIPGTPDGDYCRKWVDMDESLMHNKTVFPIVSLGLDETNRLKDLQRTLNRSVTQGRAQPLVE